MSLQLEVTAVGSVPRRIVLGEGRTTVIARPAENYRLIDEAGTAASGAAIKRVNNHLVIEGLPDERELELSNFFGACTPGRDCSLALETFGAPAGTVLTNENLPLAALPDGSFLMYSAEPFTPPLTTAADGGMGTSGGGMNYGLIAAAGGGLALVGAAGGGGGGSDPPPATTPPPDQPDPGTAPATPTITSAELTSDTRPVIGGFAAAGSTVTLTVDVGNDGSEDAVYTTTATANGTWSVDLATAVPNSGGIGAGLADLSQNGLKVTASNEFGTSAEATATVTIDASAPPAPTIALVAGDDVVNAMESQSNVTVTGTLDTAHADRLVIVSWGNQTQNATTTGVNWSVAFTPAQLPADGQTVITARYDSLTGVPSVIGVRPVVVDTVGPAAPIITDNFAGTVTNEPVVFTIAFAEPVTNFSFADLDISGGTGSGFNQTAPATFTVVVTPTPNTTGTMSVTVPAGAAADAAGNPSLGPATGSQVFDTAPPTQTFTIQVIDDVEPITGTFGSGSQINDPDPTLRFTLSSPLAAGETLRVFQGSTFLGAATGTGTVLTFAVPTLAEGNQSFTAQIRDEAGNVGPMSSTFSFVVDTTGPAAPSITDNFAGEYTNAPVIFTITFAESVTDFSFADLIISGGTGSAFSQAAPGTFTVVVTPEPNTTGTMSVTVPPAAAADAAANTSPRPDATGSQLFDTAAPTQTVVAIIGNDDTAPVIGSFGSGTATNDSTPALDFTLNAPLAAGEALQVFLNGTIVGTTAVLVDGSVSTYRFTPTLPDGEYSFTARVIDAAGNVGPTSSAFDFVVDTLRPALIITDDTEGTATGPVTFTFAFNEPVFDFTAEDVTIEFDVGTAGPFSGESGATIYTLVVNLPLTGTGDIVVSVPENAAADAAGNPSLGAESAPQPFDANIDLSLDDLLVFEGATSELRLASVSADSKFDAGSDTTGTDPTYAQSGFSDSPLLIDATIDRSIA